MKTLYVTLVDHRTLTEIVKEGNRLYPNTGDKSRYLLVPLDGVLSKSAELFNQDKYDNHGVLSHKRILENAKLDNFILYPT